MYEEIDRQVSLKTNGVAPLRQNQPHPFLTQSPHPKRDAQSEIEMEDVSELMDLRGLKRMLS